MDAVAQFVVLGFAVVVREPHDHAYRAVRPRLLGTPAADATEQMNRLRLAVEREAHALRHQRRHLPIRAVQHHRVLHLLTLRVDQDEGHARKHLRLPVREDEPFLRAVVVEEHILGAHHRGDLVQWQRHVFPLLREELQQIDELLRLDLLLEALGHQRLVRLLQRFDVVARKCDLLRLGVDQLDGGLRFGRQQPDDGAAIERDHAISLEVAFDAARRIENVNEQFFLGMHGHAGEVGADGGPFAGEQMALGALGHVHFLAAGHVAGLLEERHHLGNHALAIRVGKPAAECEQFDGSLGHALVRVGGECRLLIEGEHVEAERALLDGVEEGLDRFGFGKHEPQRGGAHGRR